MMCLHSSLPRIYHYCCFALIYVFLLVSHASLLYNSHHHWVTYATWICIKLQQISSNPDLPTFFLHGRILFFPLVPTNSTASTPGQCFPQNRSDAATSMFPPAASNVLIATSLVTPNPINVFIASSECLDCDIPAPAAGAPLPLPGCGAAPSVCPEPGNGWC